MSDFILTCPTSVSFLPLKSLLGLIQGSHGFPGIGSSRRTVSWMQQNSMPFSERSLWRSRIFGITALHGLASNTCSIRIRRRFEFYGARCAGSLYFALLYTINEQYGLRGRVRWLVFRSRWYRRGWRVCRGRRGMCGRYL